VWQKKKKKIVNFYTDATPIVKTIPIFIFSAIKTPVFATTKWAKLRRASANFATNIVHPEKGKANLHK